MPATGLVIGTFIVAPAIAFAAHWNDVPPQNYFAAETHIERLYKENGQIVSYAIMDPWVAANACPNGNQMARQVTATRVDGTREYLVWDMRCRDRP
jgi:hypothetical protein